jgi:hypothetical protein
MSDRRLQKGKYLEKELSGKLVGDNRLVFLVSPILLRERNCGQVDLAYFSKASEWLLTLVEVKNGGIMSQKQRERLRKSADFLGPLFDVNVRMKCVAKM